MKIALLTFLALATVAPAAPGVTPAGRLRLLDGRTLENAIIRSYDTESSKVLILSNGTARLIPIALIPPPFADKIKAAHARPPADLAQTTPVPDSTQQPVPPHSFPAKDTSAPAPVPPAAPAALVTKTDDLRNQHRAVAQMDAYRYFKYVFRTGSNAIAVTDLDIELGDTDPIPGWNQYRTKGKAYLEIYDSVGDGSFSRRVREFEVVTEQKPGEEIKVVDFTRK